MIGQDYPQAGPAIRCVDKASGWTRLHNSSAETYILWVH